MDKITIERPEVAVGRQGREAGRASMEMEAVAFSALVACGEVRTGVASAVAP